MRLPNDVSSWLHDALVRENSRNKREHRFRMACNPRVASRLAYSIQSFPSHRAFKVFVCMDCVHLAGCSVWASKHHHRTLPTAAAQKPLLDALVPKGSLATHAHWSGGEEANAQTPDFGTPDAYFSGGQKQFRDLAWIAADFRQHATNIHKCPM